MTLLQTVTDNDKHSRTIDGLESCCRDVVGPGLTVAAERVSQSRIFTYIHVCRDIFAQRDPSTLFSGQ